MSHHKNQKSLVQKPSGSKNAAISVCTTKGSKSSSTTTRTADAYGSVPDIVERKREQYYHTHADRLTALWAWLDNQMHTQVLQPRHCTLFEFAEHFRQFCNKNPNVYCIKNENQLKSIHTYPLETATVLLHEHLSFHYRTLKDFMAGSEPYVEYIKQLRNTQSCADVLQVTVRRPQNCVFAALERHWDERSLLNHKGSQLLTK